MKLSDIRISSDKLRDKLARDRGYPNYTTAHDAVRQEIDSIIEDWRKAEGTK